MQISRHWRMKPQRYRLEGVRYKNGEVSLQPRPFSPSEIQLRNDNMMRELNPPTLGTSPERK